MKTKICLLLCIFSFFSCQQNNKLKDNKAERLDTSSLMITHELKEDLKDKSNSQCLPKNCYSIWVFKTLKESPYPYNTTLSNGYYLKHKVFKDPEGAHYLQSLTLMKAEITIKEFGSSSYGLPYKNIGYICADFNKFFLMAYSFGSGNPHMIKLIEKETGEIHKKGTLVDVNEPEQIILYIENEHKENQKLVLIDLLNSIEIIIVDFNDLKCTHIGGLRNCIEIDTVTSEYVIIKTNSTQDNIEKRYNR